MVDILKMNSVHPFSHHAFLGLGLLQQANAKYLDRRNLRYHT